MCVAVYKPANSIITRESAHNCWETNSDGAGFMFVENGKLRVYKGFTTFKKFWRRYDHEMTRMSHPKTVLHFRIKTHGKVDFNNCHPHQVNESVALVHNGVMSNVKIKDTDFSDTYHFAKMLREMPANFMSSEPCMELILNYIGHTSKVILMNNQNQVMIINEKSGTWDGGEENKVWYSNTSFKRWAAVSQTYVSPYASEHTYVGVKKTYSVDKSGCVVPFEKPKQSESQYRYLGTGAHYGMSDAEWEEQWEQATVAKQMSDAVIDPVIELDKKDEEELAKAVNAAIENDEFTDALADDELELEEEIEDTVCESCQGALIMETEQIAGYCMDCVEDILNEMQKEYMGNGVVDDMSTSIR